MIHNIDLIRLKAINKWIDACKNMVEQYRDVSEEWKSQFVSELKEEPMKYYLGRKM